MPRRQLAVVIQRASAQAAIPPAAKLRAWLRAALPGRAGEVTLRIVDEPESAALNSRYRGRTGPTNVLSFVAEPLPAFLAEESAALGDLVVCAPLVEREAVEQGKSVEAHWAHLLVHGALHLTGYDHVSADEAEVMEDLERQLLAGLGYADPYA